ncbi:MAG: neutral zinc metallopeptidase [Planctomycetota bacterium]
MKWEGREESDNVEDRRGMKAGTMLGGGGVLVVAVVLIAQFLGADPEQAKQIGAVVNQVANKGQPQQQGGPPAQESPEEKRKAQFSRIVFKDTETVWSDLFQKMNKQYQYPTLVLFSGQVNSACGSANAAVGPFYCPGDAKVYIDLDFYADMQRQLNAPGDFARAYVIAHEVGHHVPRLLGYSAAVDEVRRRGNPVETNHASVRLELQADYLAGVWAHHAQNKFNFLEKGDVESALNAAFEIGDDRLQKKARGTVVPDSFTHGTSKQRQKWFMEGYRTGDVNGARQLFELRYEQL